MTATTRRHAAPAVLAAFVATLLVAVTLPASAADTTTTFEVASGGLAITAPATADLGTASTTGTISGSLGSVKATDSRGSLTSLGWVASATSTDFVTGAATAGETIPKADVTYQSLLGTSTGLVTCVGTLTPVAMGGSVAAMTATLATLTNSCEWNPTVTANPSGKAVGTYTGTITHSVA